MTSKNTSLKSDTKNRDSARRALLTLLLATIVGINLHCAPNLKKKKESQPLLTSKAIEIPQGVFIPFPFSPNKFSLKTMFAKRDSGFYCLLRAKSDTASIFHISHSNDLYNWTPPGIIYTSPEPDFLIKNFFSDLKSKKTYMIISQNNSKQKQALQAKFGKKWKTMSKKRGRELIQKIAVHNNEFTEITQQADFFKLETNERSEIYLQNRISGKRHFTGLVAFEKLDFLFNDQKGNLYFPYENQKYAELPLHGKGRGLIKMDIPKLTLDSDNDGMTDVQEFYLGLNSQLPDFDNDTIEDGRDSNPMVAPHQFNKNDSLRQAIFEYLIPENERQDPEMFVSINLDAGAGQSFTGNKCKVLSNATLPLHNIFLKPPFHITQDSALVEVRYMGAITEAHGFTVLMKKENDQWLAIGIDRIWSEQDY